MSVLMAGPMQVGPLTINALARTVHVDGQRVELTNREYQLLRVLAAEPTRVFTREEIHAAVWGYGQMRGRTMDTHMFRLRAKLSTDAIRLIANVWGVGYRLLDEVPAVSCPHCGGEL